MKITLVFTGKTTESYVLEGEKLFSTRISRYVPFEIKVIPELKKSIKLSEVEVKRVDGESILKMISLSDYLILLDDKGKSFTSLQFSEQLNKWMVQGMKNIVFCVGGAYGFSDEVYKRANFKLSLSPMTFNHQLIRVIFTEQLYRAFSILKGEPYHHE